MSFNFLVLRRKSLHKSEANAIGPIQSLLFFERQSKSEKKWKYIFNLIGFLWDGCLNEMIYFWWELLCDFVVWKFLMKWSLLNGLKRLWHLLSGLVWNFMKWFKVWASRLSCSLGAVKTKGVSLLRIWSMQDSRTGTSLYWGEYNAHITMDI